MGHPSDRRREEDGGCRLLAYYSSIWATYVCSCDRLVRPPFSGCRRPSSLERRLRCRFVSFWLEVSVGVGLSCSGAVAVETLASAFRKIEAHGVISLGFTLYTKYLYFTCL
ncbi:unnamed protein product [Hapterophycus canaliculatus]